MRLGKNVMVGISRINQLRGSDICYKGCDVGVSMSSRKDDITSLMLYIVFGSR